MNWYCMPCRSATFSSIGVLQERILDLVADPATHAHRELTQPSPTRIAELVLPDQ